MRRFRDSDGKRRITAWCILVWLGLLLTVSSAEAKTTITREYARLKIGYLLAILLAFAAYSTGMVQAHNHDGLEPSVSTCTNAQDSASPWQTVEMVCCHCYSTKSDGTRFYHGVLEAGFCRSQRGYCEGYAKCFP
ncbi:hypothetical protein [Desulfomonile tiedjei]|uniref:Uncharacterized protein n=1 Tax=Desulfomonile tiedjei (strain ATCC 49306 / DSM 6799 / DCB-1) TaxID=706587 RepID=I4C954_DESTA|nr:hypothetical protein [Desulfomonile tiedjei]AFM26095.1 hypothetical protein Desti_3443 [Desulfomonile tiedjei DSM 6799]